MANLDGKLALITGAGGGIGGAFARLMAARGADIALADSDGARAEATAAELRARGVRAHVEVVDMADTVAVLAMTARVARALGPVSILVNNADHGQWARLEEITVADYHRMINVHVRSAFFATQGVVGGMKAARAGKILNIASIWGMTGAPVGSHHCAAKAALIGVTKAWAKELAPWNIQVNAVAPGRVRATGPEAAEAPELAGPPDGKAPLLRACTPADIAEAVAFLASAAADGITGQVLSPNGGECIVGY